MKLGTLLAFAVLFIFNQKNEVRGMIEKKNEELEENSRLLWCLREMKLFISESPSEQSKTINFDILPKYGTYFKVICMSFF